MNDFLDYIYDKSVELKKGFLITEKKRWNELTVLNELVVQLGHVYTVDCNSILDEKYRNIVLVQDIPCFSLCEHHLALMYNMKISVAYIPKNKIIGLSKIVRIVDMVCKRLQLQERIGSDIAEIIHFVTESEDIAVIIKAEHSCMTARGIKKGGVTKTSTLKGIFFNNADSRNEIMLLMK